MEQMDENFRTPSLRRSKRVYLQTEAESPLLHSSSLDDAESFKTPLNKSKKLKLNKGATTPMLVPPSPCMKKLGYGTGINVYLIERFSPMKGTYKSPWAVKKINSRVRQNPEFKIRLEEEAKILKSLSHPNIIGFRSEGRSRDGNMCLVMESGQRSLADLIEIQLEKDLGPFPASDILKVAKGLSAALNYLHEECHLLHGDLKSGNVLVKDDFSAVKLCDFGVSLKLNNKLTADDTKEYIGTECWSAPEVLCCKTVSNKTDMFSYGLILWEMLALCPPHHDKLDIDSSLMKNVDDQTLEKLELEAEEEYQKALGTRPCIPDLSFDESYHKVMEIFYLCTEENPSKRLSAKQIMESYFKDE